MKKGKELFLPELQCGAEVVIEHVDGTHGIPARVCEIGFVHLMFLVAGSGLNSLYFADIHPGGTLTDYTGKEVRIYEQEPVEAAR